MNERRKSLLTTIAVTLDLWTNDSVPVLTKVDPHSSYTFFIQMLMFTRFSDFELHEKLETLILLNQGKPNTCMKFIPALLSGFYHGCRI